VAGDRVDKWPRKTAYRVAAVQIAPDLETRAATVTKVLGSIAEAAEKGARLAFFPKLSCPGIRISPRIPPVLTGAEHIRLYDNAVVVPGPVTKRSRLRRGAMAWSSCSASTNATTARSTMPAHFRRRRSPRSQAAQDYADFS